jgi:hypothetical protein
VQEVPCRPPREAERRLPLALQTLSALEIRALNSNLGITNKTFETNFLFVDLMLICNTEENERGQGMKEVGAGSVYPYRQFDLVGLLVKCR